MKKNYILAVLFAFGMVTANAQFAMDDMESYGGGNAGILNAHWSSWDGTAAIAMFSSGAQAQSGSLSGYVDDSTAQDPLLLLGDKIFGSWGVKFSVYIPSGKQGYFNMQGQEAPGIQWVVGNITLGLGDPSDDEFTGRIDMSTAALTDDFTFQFPKDTWFDIIMNYDFNLGAGASTWTMWVHDGTAYQVAVPVGTPYADGGGVYAQALGGINFYSSTSNNEMYVDDVEYINAFYPDPTLGVNDSSAAKFTAYPNPVKNVLNINAVEDITSVVIYNVLGQQVYASKVNALSTTVDMSGFASGAYMVKVNTAGSEGIIKILK